MIATLPHPPFPRQPAIFSPLLEHEVRHLQLVAGAGNGDDALVLPVLGLVDVNLGARVGPNLTDPRAALADDGAHGLAGRGGGSGHRS